MFITTFEEGFSNDDPPKDWKAPFTARSYSRSSVLTVLDGFRPKPVSQGSYAQLLEGPAEFSSNPN